jgi:nitrate/nitrite transporter NarK
MPFLAGWVGSLGALGGFVIPPVMGFALRDLGPRGYAIGFIVFVFLALFGLSIVWVLKYTRDAGLRQPKGDRAGGNASLPKRCRFSRLVRTRESV